MPRYQLPENQPAQTILGVDKRHGSLTIAGLQGDLENLGQHRRYAWICVLTRRICRQGLTKPWPGAGFAGFGGGDYSSSYVERGEIYDFVRDHGITGFATIAGDRHSFWAGVAAKGLPPAAFEPVGVAFITGSISAPGLVEAFEHHFPKDHPMRPLFLAQGPNDAKPQPTVNMLLRHGVRSCLEYAKSGDISRARALTNPDLAPHLSFVDMGGHGYAVVGAAHESSKPNSSASRVHWSAASMPMVAR